MAVLPYIYSMMVVAAGLSAPVARAASPIVIGTTTTFEKLVPFHQEPGENHFVRNLVAPPFIALNEKWEWSCVVCTQLPSLETETLRVETFKHRGKRLVTEWEIAKHWTWANGRPVTGYDVEFTFQYLKRKISDRVKRQHFPVEQVQVNEENPRRFKIVFRQIRSDFAQTLAVSLLPSYLRQVNHHDPKDPGKSLNVVTADQHNLKEDYFYYGPYKFAQRIGNRLELDVNSNYENHERLPPKVHIMHYDSRTYMLSQLVAGQIQMIREGELSWEDIAKWQDILKTDAGLKKRLQLAKTEGNVLEHIVVNLRNPLLTDSRIRKALLLGIDRQKLNDLVFKGNAGIADHLLNKQDPLYSPPLRVYAYQPEKAIKLLEEAGWLLEEGERVRERDEEKLRLTLVTTDDSDRRALAKFIQESWEKLGIQLKVETQSRDKFLGRTIPKVKFKDLALYSWRQTPGSAMWSNLHSKSIPSDENNYDGGNTTGWFKNEVNQTLDSFAVELEPVKQKELMATLMKHYVIDLPTLPLFFRPVAGIAPAGFKNFKVPGHLFESSLYLPSWFENPRIAKK